VWDKRKTLTRAEHVVAIVILATFVLKGFLPGLVVGIVMAVVLFAISYSRIEPAQEVAFGETFRSNVDRPSAERAALRRMAERVQVLRANGFLFFGSANGILGVVRTRVAQDGLRFLVMDLQRVNGIDSSAVVSFDKIAQLAETHGFELVFAGASEPVRAQLARGGVSASSGVVAFEPDLDRGLQRCEDGLLAEAALEPTAPDGQALAQMPLGLVPHAERESLDAGATLIRQDDPREDVFVLVSGRLAVEMRTLDGGRMRLRTVHPGVMVGEIALYTGAPRTADVIAETPSVVLRLRRSAIGRIDAEDPELARELHRWLAGTLAERLTDTQRALEALAD
jgi:sulfate permease, SulP family